MIFSCVVSFQSKKKKIPDLSLPPVDKMNIQIFLIRIIINWNIRTFMSLGVLWEYAKSLFASSPCTHRFFPCILRMRLNTFRAFGDNFVYHK